MFSRLTVTLVLALSCIAHPLVHVHSARKGNGITLPIAKKFNFTGSSTILNADQVRARKLAVGRLPSRDEETGYEVPVTNVLVSYIAQVSVGTPATQYELIVDSGSANTWVGAKPLLNGYKISQSTKLTGRSMSVSYGSGSFTGVEVEDTLRLGSLAISQQRMGAALFSNGFGTVDGILGIGPSDLTIGTTVPGQNSPVPTIVDTAMEENLIDSPIVGIYFQPPQSNNDINGVMTLGHVDHSQFTGNLAEGPFTTNANAQKYVGIDQSIAYGDSRIPILDTTSGIVDTGTSLILLTADAYARYMQVTGATFDKNAGLLSLPADQYDNLQSLYFTMMGVQYEFTKNAQIWPRSLNANIGGTADKIYLIIGNGSTGVGDGINFINGQTFLERFYTTYDATNKVFGIAITNNTYSMAN